MSGLFGSIQNFRPKKNKFDLSHEKKMSFKMGTLTPFLLQEVIPGDQFRVNTEMLMRLQPMLAPIFHRIRVKTDYFFVPNRLVWDNWQKFITGGEDGNDATVAPYFLMEQAQIDAGYCQKGSLWDYMGLPTIEKLEPLTAELKVNALPFRAYQLIYNEYFRDENLVPKVNVTKTDGQDGNTGSLTELQKRAWEKDYYTSALPWAQKGGAVTMPTDIQYKVGGTLLRDVGGAPVDPNGALTATGAGGDATSATFQAANSGNLQVENIDSIGTTINDLRVAVRLQEWLEKNARAGSRYIESILAHFGVLSSDARLQRPEYLGGNQNPIVISEVLSSYQNADDSGYPQGNMSGHGIATGGNGGFKRRFEEHGFVIGIMTVLPRTAYQQGIAREWQRFDKLEYAWPSFAQLGEQEIKNSELYFDNAGVNNAGTFGYQSRYAEYKFKPSTVHGDFRDNLDYWHMGRKFAAQPVLNRSFIEADPTKRIFAVTDQTEDEILCQIYNRVDALRPLPYFNSPTL
ncbi:MAG: major capsid protein [Microviridae sp.]|nr:MAG: major capsid protein [Microviridae sp.]